MGINKNRVIQADQVERLISKTQQLMDSGVRYTYDHNGNISTKQRYSGEMICYTYDELNRVTSITGANGAVKTYSYDAVGNMTSVTDEEGYTTSYKYSPNGNLIEECDSLGNRTCYEYDCMGHLTKVTRGGQVTCYEWNKSGRLSKMTDPLGAFETYRYNKNGALVEKVNKNGDKTWCTLTGNGDRKELFYADGRSVAYSYNALRQLEEVKDWTGTTKISLDALGRPLTVTDPEGKSIGYEWGSMNEKTKLVYPDGSEVEYEYLESGALHAVSWDGERTVYQYDAVGRPAGKELPNGVHTSYTYNEAGRLESLMHKGNEIHEEYRFCYDARGNKTRVVKNRESSAQDSGSFEYEYDALKRLTAVKKGNELLRTYQYDALGNRLTKTEYGDGEPVITTYVYNKRNQLMEERQKEAESRTYEYDANGNLTEIRKADRVLKSYHFDLTNRMCEAFDVEENESKTVRYEYNGMGHRIGEKQFTGTNKTLQVNMQYTVDLTRNFNNLLSSSDKVSGKVQNFIWDSNVVAMKEEKTSSYYLQDDLGSPIVLAGQIGTKRQSYAYDEFGVPMQAEKNLQPFGFTGYQNEEAGDLYFAQTRRYDARNGRFTSEDPIRHKENWYVYCSANPQNYFDPLGLYEMACGMEGTATDVDGDADLAPAWLENFFDTWRKRSFLYRAFATATKNGIFDDLFGALDFERGEDGIFHVDTNKYSISLFGNDYSGCWQQFGGYNPLYDWGFDAGTSMDKSMNELTTSDGDTYTIWLWKGDYLNLGSGGECGIYKGSGWQKQCDLKDAMPMTLSIDYGDGHTSEWSDSTWWITSFNPAEQGKGAGDIKITGTLDFSNVSEEVWNGFKDTYDIPGSMFQFNGDTKIVTYTW